jgi:hypothetical protein
MDLDSVLPVDDMQDFKKRHLHVAASVSMSTSTCWQSGRASGKLHPDAGHVTQLENVFLLDCDLILGGCVFKKSSVFR